MMTSSSEVRHLSLVLWRALKWLIDSTDAAKSSLPVVRHAVRNEELAAANNLDRMTIWIRNVEST